LIAPNELAPAVAAHTEIETIEITVSMVVKTVTICLKPKLDFRSCGSNLSATAKKASRVSSWAKTISGPLQIRSAPLLLPVM